MECWRGSSGERVKITVDVTKPELDVLEARAILMPICDKHKKMLEPGKAHEPPKDCKKCLGIDREWSSKTLHFWSKLTTAYLKALEEAKKRRKR